MKQDRKYFSKIGLAFFAGTILIYTVQMGTGRIVANLRPQWLEDNNAALLVSMLSMYLVAMPLMIFLITRIKATGVTEKHSISVGKMILAFFMCYAIMYISNIAGTIITNIIGIIKGTPVVNIMTDLVLGTNTWLLFLFTVLCAPFYEEFIFRKLLVDRAVKYGEGVAVLLSGLMFGLFHGNLTQFAYAFFLGIFFAFIYVKTGKIRYTIILHMIVNFMGSIVGAFILQKIDINALQDMLNQMSSGTASDGMAAMQAIAPALIFMVLYLILIIIIVVTGVVLLIVYRKKFRVSPGEVSIPKGKRFTTVIVNLGMILFTAFWVIQMIRQLLQ